MKNCRFRKTNLENADLTDTKIHHACMTKANLENARLAQIDWTDCDLRWANLKNVTFHFGSTRCGLVGSPYPSHGTRTGFYTEELADLYFQQPEVIRKASLVGCDLRGADITGVDFYLIDLRDAKLTRSQRAQAAKMGAILD